MTAKYVQKFEILSTIPVTNVDLTHFDSRIFETGPIFGGQIENQPWLETLKGPMNKDLRVIDIGETVSTGSNERLLSGLG